MIPGLSAKSWFWIAMAACCYFILIVSIAAYRSSYALIGVAIELLTIPALIALAASAAGSIVILFRRKDRLYPLVTLLIVFFTLVFLAWN